MGWLRRAWLPLLCAAVALVSVLTQPVALQVLRNAQFDQFQRWQPRPYVDAGVVVVDVDDESLRRQGQWPWPRTRVAQLLDALRAQGAIVVAMDVLLVEPDRTSPQRVAAQWPLAPSVRQALDALPDHDQVLAHSLGNGGVVLGMALEQASASTASGLQALPGTLPYRVMQMGESAQQRLHAFDGATLPLPPLLEAASGVGALNFIADSDGVVRRVPLLFAVGNQVAPSLVAELLRVAQGGHNYLLKAVAAPGVGLQELRIGPLAVPTTAEGEMWVHYSTEVPARLEPAWKVLEGASAPQRFADKLVLVGASAQGLMDLRVNPMGQVMPGVLAHAQALEQILTAETLQRPAWAQGLEALVVVLGCLCLGLVATTTRAAVSASGALALVGATGLGAWWAFSHEHLLLNALEPMVWMALTYLLCGGLHHLATEREQRWIRQAFSRYVSPNRVEHLVQHHDQLELGGKRQECSFIFTDLAGFTTMMEAMDATRAVALLNAYLDRMIAIGFEHGGTLDRIMGDAVAIVFSAPLEQADHRQRAVHCALAMDAFASAYARQVQSEQGIPFGHTRIGVHTGEVIVGNFGGSTMFDYRALGDAVNTASRLEAVNKHLGTRLCVSKATLSACPEVPARPVAHLVLKGKKRALEVWEPVAAQMDACAPADEYRAAYDAVENQEPGALPALERLALQYPHDPLVALHLQRLQRGERGVQIVLLEK